MVGLTVALSTGLFAPHVLVPPTPGPLAAAANLELENLFLLIAIGASIAFILILVGGAYGHYLTQKKDYDPILTETKKSNPKTVKIPSFFKALLPILVPILLMCIGTLLKFLPPDFLGVTFLSFITKPTSALGIGMLFAFGLVRSKRKTFLNNSIKKGIEQAAPILIIT